MTPEKSKDEDKDFEIKIKIASRVSEVWMTTKFLKQISEIRNWPVALGDVELTSLIDDCINNEALAELVTPEIKVLRFGDENQLSIYFSTISRKVGQADNGQITCKKYYFVHAEVGHHWVNRNSKNIGSLGRLLVRLLGTGMLANKAASIFEKLRKYLEEVMQD